MTSEEHSKTFLDWVLALLHERFPWLGSADESAIAGADTIDELVGLHRLLIDEREKLERKKG